MQAIGSLEAVTGLRHYSEDGDGASDGAVGEDTSKDQVREATFPRMLEPE